MGLATALPSVIIPYTTERPTCSFFLRYFLLRFPPFLFFADASYCSTCVSPDRGPAGGERCARAAVCETAFLFILPLAFRLLRSTYLRQRTLGPFFTLSTALYVTRARTTELSVRTLNRRFVVAYIDTRIVDPTLSLRPVPGSRVIYISDARSRGHLLLIFERG